LAIKTGMISVDQLAYLTPTLPGVGGVLKQRPEDFLVEEQPLYEPTGKGEHLYLFIEKRELTTMELLKRVAKDFRVNKDSVGYAGLKDKHAVTRQHVSVHLPVANVEHEAQSVERIQHHPKIKVLWAERHANKLRRGHHGGNRFVLKVRGVAPTSVVQARPTLDTVARSGFPNYIGEQRFGYRGNSHTLGRMLLLGDFRALLDELLGTPGSSDSEELAIAREYYRQSDYLKALDHWPRGLPYDRQALDALRQHKTHEQAVRAIHKTQRSFLVSALQSAIFNTVLNQRVRDQTWNRLLPGDLAWKDDSRAVFAVDEATAALENAPGGRVERFEVCPSGPLWGTDMTEASGGVGELERAAVTSQGIDLSMLTRSTPWADTAGARRPLRILPRNLDYSGGADEHGPYLRISFELPRGAYATMLLREVMKCSAGTPDESTSD
jgi:tRNA pseudouridine13 synthase